MEESRIAIPIGSTLDRFIKDKQKNQSTKAHEGLPQILCDIALASKVINREINKAGLVDILGAAGSTNSVGDQQQKLDLLANIRFTRALLKGREVCALVSEESETYTELNKDGKYIITMDPLDGSSNIDVNVSIGTIFSVYQRKSAVGSAIEPADILQSGNEQLAAGYILYGSSTILVFSTGQGVNGFTYEPTLGEYFLSHPDIQVPTVGKIYSVNEGLANYVSQDIRDYIQFCKDSDFTARYIGSLVADFHRNLLKGGIYLYPPTEEKPQGKLRLTYECNALAFIIEHAGGMASDGKNRILDIKPEMLHQLTPLYIGSKTMVTKMISTLKN